MKKEELTALGLTEEQIGEVFKLNGLDIESYKDKNSNLETQLETTNASLLERDKQLDDLKLNAGNSEELQSQIKKLQEENTIKAEEYKQALEKTQFDNEFEKALIKANVRDVKIASAAFNKEELKYEEGKLKGFDEQLNQIKESHEYLFADKVPAGTGGSLGNGEKGRRKWNSKEDILSIENDEERLEAIQENLELFD